MGVYARGFRATIMGLGPNQRTIGAFRELTFPAETFMNWTAFYLVLAVLFEAFGTACIQASQQFSRIWPSLGVVLGYGGAFWFLSLTLRDLPLGVVYATWSGLGIVFACGSGWILFGQSLDAAAALGIFLIAAGILVMHLFSGGLRT